MSEQMSFADGKYIVINDNGNLTALRYGEPWNRDLTGDNLVYWMLVESLELKRQRDELLEALKGTTELLRVWVDGAPPYEEAENDRKVIANARATITKVK